MIQHQFLILCLEFLIHQIDRCSCASNEECLHGGVVQRYEAGEQVQVPGHKHHQEQYLGPSRYSSTAPGLPDLEQK